MESVKDVLNSFKERLTNPFLGAFVISWLVFNYDIIITLLVYDETIWQTNGQKTVLDFIQSRLCIEKSLWYPLASAFGYVLLFPVLKNLVNIYMAFSGKWGSKRVFSVSKEGAVSMERYFKMKGRVKEQIERLKEAVQEESEYLEKINGLEVENSELQSNLNKEKGRANEMELARDGISREMLLREERLTSEILGVQAQLDSEREENKSLHKRIEEYEDQVGAAALNGYWKITWKMGEVPFSRILHFDMGTLFSKKNATTWDQVAMIKAFNASKNGSLVFVREVFDSNSRGVFPRADLYTVSELHKISDTVYEGLEYGNISVRYEVVS